MHINIYKMFIITILFHHHMLVSWQLSGIIFPKTWKSLEIVQSRDLLQFIILKIKSPQKITAISFRMLSNGKRYNKMSKEKFAGCPVIQWTKYFTQVCLTFFKVYKTRAWPNSDIIHSRKQIKFKWTAG